MRIRLPCRAKRANPSARKGTDMTIDEKLKTAKEGVTLLAEVMKAARDDPNVQVAGSELGKTALTITKTINNALLPLAAINFAFDKAREYFAERFQCDLGDKAAGIPPDKVVEPKASVAGPALQGLAFSHEEPDLKDMYLNLLTSAMDGRVADRTHPAFVEIIRQPNSEEAKLLRSVIRAAKLPVAEIRLTAQLPNSWHMLLRHLLNLRGPKSGQPLENQRIPAIVDNWIRLGLVEVSYSEHLAGLDSYNWVEERPGFRYFRATRETQKEKVTFQKGILERTAFGEQFATVVGLLSHQASVGTIIIDHID